MLMSNTWNEMNCNVKGVKVRDMIVLHSPSFTVHTILVGMHMKLTTNLEKKH